MALHAIGHGNGGDSQFRRNALGKGRAFALVHLIIVLGRSDVDQDAVAVFSTRAGAGLGASFGITTTALVGNQGMAVINTHGMVLLDFSSDRVVHCAADPSSSFLFLEGMRSEWSAVRGIIRYGAGNVRHVLTGVKIGEERMGTMVVTRTRERSVVMGSMVMAHFAMFRHKAVVVPEKFLHPIFVESRAIRIAMMLIKRRNLTSIGSSPLVLATEGLREGAGKDQRRHGEKELHGSSRIHRESKKLIC